MPGKLSDVFGRKRIVLWGIVSFLISSALCALSVDMLMLIVARGLQGACGGVIASSAFYYYSGTFSCKKKGLNILVFWLLCMGWRACWGP